MRFSGELLRNSGDLKGAVAVFQKILEKSPNDLAARLSRGNVLLVLGRLGDAQKDIDVALKVAPRSIPANYLEALLMARQGNLDKADDILGKISPSFIALPQGYYLQGAVKYALGQYEQAETSLTKYLARKPDQAGAKRLLALIALRKKNPARAITLLKPVVAANPANTAALAVLAQAYVASGKQDDAVALYEKAAHVNPNDTAAQTRAALMNVRFGDATEGVSDLEKIAGSDKGADVAGPILVLSALERGDVAKAAASAEELAKRQKDDPIVQNLLGSVRIAQQRFADAAAIFAALVKKDPNFLAARRNLAVVQRELKHPDEAKATYLDVLARKPDDVASLLGLAQLAAANGDTREAVDRLKQAIAAAPRDRVPAEELVRVYASQRDWDDALKTAQALETQFPADLPVVNLAASIRAEMGDTAGAAAEFRGLTQRLPNSDSVWWQYAGYQDRAGDKEGARGSLVKALSLASDNPTYLEDLVKLDYETKGAGAAMATARSYAVQQPAFSEVMVAQVLAYDKRLPEAIDLLQKTQQQHPATIVIVRLAMLTYAAGKHDAALQLLTSWVKDHDDDIAARIGLADMLMVNHDYDAAQQDYEIVRQHAPGNVVALNNLAWIYARKHDPKAADLAREAYRLAPSPQTSDTLGWALVSGGDAKSGLPYLQRAGAALPDDAAIQYHLAVALHDTGEQGQARDLLEHLLKAKATFDGKGDAERLLDQLQHG